MLGKSFLNTKHSSPDCKFKILFNMENTHANQITAVTEMAIPPISMPSNLEPAISMLSGPGALRPATFITPDREKQQADKAVQAFTLQSSRPTGVAA
jgi:hypothetical protein